MFKIGSNYTRAEIGDQIGFPEDKRAGGAFTTGYFEHNDSFYLFANIGLPGRTGHNYPNRWQDAYLVWSGKSQTRLGQPQIERLIDGTHDVHVFWRARDRAPFTYAGRALALEAIDNQPVEIVWGFESQAVGAVREGDGRAPKPVWRRGPRPSAGERLMTLEEKPTTLYLMKLVGVTETMHPRLSHGISLIKVGITTSPERRLKELNSGFPPGLQMAWEIIDTRQFPNGNAAFEEEGRLLERLRIAEQWIGGEYAVSREVSLSKLFS